MRTSNPITCSIMDGDFNVFVQTTDTTQAPFCRIREATKYLQIPPEEQCQGNTSPMQRLMQAMIATAVTDVITYAETSKLPTLDPKKGNPAYEYHTAKNFLRTMNPDFVLSAGFQDARIVMEGIRRMLKKQPADDPMAADKENRKKCQH